MKLKKLILIVGLLASVNGYATQYVVRDTPITIIASGDDSGAHMILAQKGIYNGGEHPWCGREAYINFSEWGLFSLAVAASIRNKPINFIYDDDAPPKMIKGHVAALKCRVFSIFN